MVSMSSTADAPRVLRCSAPPFPIVRARPRDRTMRCASRFALLPTQEREPALDEIDYDTRTNEAPRPFVWS